MKKIVFALSLGVFSMFSAQDWKTDDQYIQNFAKYAVEEMELYKIPASIKLAQGILETGGGQSRLAREGKNHFGIKCKENWTGKTMKHTDDAPNECFRVYDNPRESYRDHSLFLAHRKYYVRLFKLDMRDYKAWAYGLKKAGYATNPRYAQILIDRIERYKLYEFDYLKPHEVEAKLEERYPGYKPVDKVEIAKTEVVEEKIEPKKEEKPAVPVVEVKPLPEPKLTKVEILKAISIQSHPNGGLKYVVLPGDLDLSSLSQKYGINESRLMTYNELRSQNLKKGQIIFLESKNSSGSQEFYTAQKGDRMYDIAQKFGIKLRKLYTKNRMEEGREPVEGQKIYLQSKKPRREM
ncbi:MAG: glucosaminidase domain-containing protein [Flavobacteriaceae bacterium]|nr:glucosaminidase domain-containing protein [Flavobacteriaceae bacterium]